MNNYFSHESKTNKSYRWIPIQSFKCIFLSIIPLFIIAIGAPSCLITSSDLNNLNQNIKQCSKYAFTTSSLTPFEKYFYLDNSVNVHILNNESFFNGPISPCSFNFSIGTIWGSEKPRGIGNATIKWKDDQEKIHYKYLKDVYFHLNSLVNVFSTSKLAIDEKDPLSTSIYSFAYHSIFRWNNNEDMIKTQHGHFSMPRLLLESP